MSGRSIAVSVAVVVRVNVSVGRAPEGWREVARTAEDIGVYELRVADHLATGLPAPFTTLAAAAAVTTHLRIGTYVLNNDLRHPVLVAGEAATLAEVSDGRFTLGLGAGHMRSEYEAAGLTFETPAVRVARLAESVEVLTRLLAGGTVEFVGAHYRVHHEVRSPDGPPVRVLVGGNGPTVLRTAARLADVVAFTGFSPIGDGTDSDLAQFGDVGLAQRTTIVQSAAPDRSPVRDVLVQVVEVTDRTDVALDRLSGRLGLPVEVVRSSPFLLIGSVAQIVEKVHSLHDRFGISEITVFGHRQGQSLASIAPIIEGLASIRSDTSPDPV
jgi:probable F420-dependent oxidoreductase